MSPLSSKINKIAIVLLIVADLLLFHTHTRAVTTTILHKFGDGSVSNDGTDPSAAMVQGTDGNYYGTAYEGGTANKGTVFKMTSTGTVTILHSFGATTSDGAYPTAALVQGTDGNFYGTTESGGTGLSSGTVFKITSGGTLTILHNFLDGSVVHDGAEPSSAGVVQDTDGNFYGTTYAGGSAGIGSIYRITPAGSVTILHSFGDGSVTNDGYNPLAGLVVSSNGNLYGTTFYGGAANDGTLFRITPAGSYTLLWGFHGSDGIGPMSPLIQAQTGYFYGTARTGGSANKGTVFKLSFAGVGGQLTVVNVLHNFGDGSVTNDGANPRAAVLQAADGNFYGTTEGGGSASKGTVFEMTYTGSMTILHHFGDGSVTNDGSYPEAPLIQSPEGYFYGTTVGGGAFGSAFKIDTYTVLHNFHDGSITNDGINPMDSLVLGTDGNFYGTTNQGGAANKGTVFKATPSGTVTILHSFSDGSITNDGTGPATLIRGTDGNFYGITVQGGSAGCGIVFKITPSGVVTILHNFSDGSVTNDGLLPAGLCKATDGNFYGTTWLGGSASAGTVFKITPGGTVTILHSLGTITNEGRMPLYGVIQAADGNFYGTCESGGSANFGVVYKITPSGTVTVLHSFADGSITNDGKNPYAGLIQASDGNLYGTTTYGGVANDGIIFKITPTGTETILHRFGDGSVLYDGVNPFYGVIQGADGNFYGTTGYSPYYGTVYKLTPAGVETILHEFGSFPNDGIGPQGGLIFGLDGSLYGTTWQGGTATDGILFKIMP